MILHYWVVQYFRRTTYHTIKVSKIYKGVIEKLITSSIGIQHNIF